MACHPDPVFTPKQSAEIDRRIVEMMTAVMGNGQYSRICQGIADRRASDIVAADDASVTNEDRSMNDQEIRFECLRLAVGTGQREVLKIARAFEGFVTGRAVSDAEDRLAAVRAELEIGADA